MVQCRGESKVDEGIKAKKWAEWKHHGFCDVDGLLLAGIGVMDNEVCLFFTIVSVIGGTRML